MSVTHLLPGGTPAIGLTVLKLSTQTPAAIHTTPALNDLCSGTASCVCIETLQQDSHPSG